MELTMERLDLVTEAERLVAVAAERGVVARMLGGVAVAMRCPTARTEPFLRDYSDLDVVIRQSDRNQIDAVLGELGFEGDRAFNARFGNERRCYHREDGLKLDVFVECFSMCHDVPLDADRLGIDDRTVPLAELLLTKAQIVELNEKDANDLFVLFHDHAPADDDRGINEARAGEVCARDWGLWRTVTGTLQALRDAVARIDAAPEARVQVSARAQRMVEALEAAPKSRKWKLRSRVGERKQWYVLPEEPNEAVDLREL
jgi:Uncharacterised nucleotidyltransferase